MTFEQFIEDLERELDIDRRFLDEEEVRHIYDWWGHKPIWWCGDHWREWQRDKYDPS